MKYNFKRIKDKKVYCGCSVCDKYVYLSREFIDEIKKELSMEEITSCNVSVDEKNKVIAFFFCLGRDDHKITKQRDGYIVNLSVINVLPKGRYLYDKSIPCNDGFSCVYNNII